MLVEDEPPAKREKRFCSARGDGRDLAASHLVSVPWGFMSSTATTGGPDRPAPRTGRVAWHNRSFRRLWAGQSVSHLGSQVSLLALPLTAAVLLDAGAVQMGILTALSRAPYLLLGLLVGVWVDRLPRRRSLVAVNLALAVVLAGVPVGALLGWLSLGLLYVVTVMTGALTVFFDIAYLAYVPLLVPSGQRPDAQGMIEVTQSTGQLAGPALGGWLVQTLTAPVAVAMDAVSYLFAAATVAMIPDRGPGPAGTAATGVVAAIRAGVRVVFGQPVLRAVTLATTTMVFWTSATTATLVLYLLRDLRFAPWVLDNRLTSVSVELSHTSQQFSLLMINGAEQPAPLIGDAEQIHLLVLMAAHNLEERVDPDYFDPRFACVNPATEVDIVDRPSRRHGDLHPSRHRLRPDNGRDQLSQPPVGGPVISKHRQHRNLI